MKSEVSNPYNYYSMVFFRGNSFVDYVCWSCVHALRGYFCKHRIAIFLKFLPDCRETSILEYCGSYYGTQRGDWDVYF